MNTNSPLKVSRVTALKVGSFTALGLILVVIYIILVNNRPYWWRPCQLVRINVEDASGLKSKAPIRSLGIEIGYLKSVMLSESHVTLGICVTAPIEVLPETRAYIRGEGFLGDKFVELKPVKYIGPMPEAKNDTSGSFRVLRASLDFLFPSAHAASAPVADTVQKPKGREIPVGSDSQDMQHVVTRVDELVKQMSGLTDGLRQGINPEELRKTMKQLNQTLENASKTLAPEGGLNQTAQRSLAKLEDAIEQMRDLMTRVNKGEGSLGMLLNDPVYAEEIRLAIRNINLLLNKASQMRLVIDLGASPMTIYNGTRGFLNIGIWPNKERYYLLGFASDPRGRLSNVTTTTTVAGITQVTQTVTAETTAIMFTGMLGKIFWDRLDLSVGILYNDGAVSAGLRLGPNENPDMFVLRNDVYSRSAGGSIDDRISLIVKPFPGMFKSIYVRAGIESLNGYRGQMPFLYGAGLTFDDDDIKLLFALR